MSARIYPRKLIGSIDLRQTQSGYEPIHSNGGVIYCPFMPVFEDECFTFIDFVGDFQRCKCNECGMMLMNDNTKKHFETCDAIYEKYYGRKRTTTT